MIQSGLALADFFLAISKAIFLTRVEALKRGVKKGVILARNAAPELAEKATEYYVNKGINNRGILFKRTRKITSQEDGFINFVRPLMTTRLPLMKNILHH